MRNFIIDFIFAEMSKNKKLFFVTADMGINLVEKIQKKFPKRYLNVGIAEQSLISVCAGLANIGFKPFAYSISNFVIHRCFEQIRNDMSLHNYPITLLGTSTGYDNPELGPTHHILDDWGCLKTFPNIDIFCPYNIHNAERILREVIRNSKPSYIRITKSLSEPIQNKFFLKDIVEIKNKKKSKLLITYGSTIPIAFETASKNFDISLVILSKLSPINEKKLLNVIKKYSKILILEDHFASTGLYSTICQILIKNNLNTKVESIAPSKYVLTGSKDQRFLMSQSGINYQNIKKKINKIK